MASLWEIFDTTALQYHTGLGFTQDDAGAGPPTLSEGWVRTGFQFGLSGGIDAAPGIGHYDAWTTTRADRFGTVVSLPGV
jgi:hypothetical protein